MPVERRTVGDMPAYMTELQVMNGGLVGESAPSIEKEVIDCAVDAIVDDIAWTIVEQLLEATTFRCE